MADFDPIGTLDFFRERLRVESATTSRLLRALPNDMLSYRWHPESSTVGTTAWTIVRGLMICTQLTENANAEVPQNEVPTYEVLVSEFERQAQALQVSLLHRSQTQWCETRRLTSSHRVLLEQPLGQILWLFLFDGIHHRGQLSTYLRPLGARVPSIYGPSGDHPA